MVMVAGHNTSPSRVVPEFGHISSLLGLDIRFACSGMSHVSLLSKHHGICLSWLSDNCNTLSRFGYTIEC